ncbi:MAG: hypothetical protein ACREOS_11965 [Candidatus Dormibacteraceae bacterium]
MVAIQPADDAVEAETLLVGVVGRAEEGAEDVVGVDPEHRVRDRAVNHPIMGRALARQDETVPDRVVKGDGEKELPSGDAPGAERGGHAIAGDEVVDDSHCHFPIRSASDTVPCGTRSSARYSACPAISSQSLPTSSG